MNADKSGSEKRENFRNRKMIRTILLLVVLRLFLSAFLRVHPQPILLARVAKRLRRWIADPVFVSSSLTARSNFPKQHCVGVPLRGHPAAFA
jgi:hypothetical protein